MLLVLFYVTIIGFASASPFSVVAYTGGISECLGAPLKVSTEGCFIKDHNCKEESMDKEETTVLVGSVKRAFSVA